MTREQYINGLRALADVVERNENFPYATPAETVFYVFDSDENVARLKVAAFARSVGATGKSFTSEYLFLDAEVSPGFKVRLGTPRSTVCRKVKVMKEVEEWDCEPILATESAD